MKRREFTITCAGALGSCVLASPVLSEEGEGAKKKLPLAACGLDCNTCGTRVKGCEGCHGPDDKVWCGQCKMRTCCIKEKKLSNCSECDDFPCEHNTEFENDKYQHHRKAIARLRKMRTERDAARRQPRTGAEGSPKQGE